jgi:hypothetical protein
MGFELFVHAFRNGERFYYPRSIAEEIFNRGAIDPGPSLETVEYADGRAEIYGASEDPMDGFVLAHFSGRTVLERALELAVRTGSIIVWPGKPPWAVPDLVVVDHLPGDPSENRAQFVVVSDVDELIRMIQASLDATYEKDRHGGS